jgi:hypothetical protein
MTLYVCNKIADYWNMKDFTPNYPITDYMSRDRFQELYMRVRLAGTEAEGPYAKVSFILLFLLTYLLILASFRSIYLAHIYKTSI